jgi:eukaryotic-like serine/threonine-protein kinase
MSFLQTHYFLITIAVLATLALAMVGYSLSRRKAGRSGAHAERDLKVAKVRRLAEVREKGRAYLTKGRLDDAFAQFAKLPLDDEVMGLLEQIALGHQAAGDSKRADKVLAYLARQNKAYRKFSRQMPGANTVIMMDEAPADNGPPAVSWPGMPPGTSSIDAPTVQMRAMPELMQPREKPKRAAKISQLGPYRLKRLVSENAAGMVYLGVDDKTGSEAIVKAFPITQGDNGRAKQEALMEFAESARTLSGLNHPNIAKLIRAGQADGIAFVAMETMAGAELSEHCEPGKLLHSRDVTSIAVRIADALSQAHERHCYHGDIRPSLMYYDSPSGAVKLMDFGLARIATRVDTAAGVIHGTPSYMSPEQISGRKIDGRSDLFSLAVTCYQLYCGRLPFVADNFNELMYRIVSSGHADVREAHPELPADITAFFDRALAKNPKQRFQTAHEFATALRKAMAWSG